MEAILLITLMIMPEKGGWRDSEEGGGELRERGGIERNENRRSALLL